MKSIIQKIKLAYAKDWVKIVSVFVFFSIVAALVYISVPGVASLDDPLFHIRFAEILRERGFGAFHDFQWIYFSKMAQQHSYFIYYNFLFYVVLMGFTFFTPLIFGIKIYGVIFAALAFTTLYSFLLKSKEKYAFVWTIIFFIIFNTGRVARFFVARPFTLAPALLILELYLLYRKRYFSLFILGLVYFFWHTATFFFVPGVAALYFLFENFYGKKFDWKIILSVFSSITLAIVAVSFFAPGLFLYMKDIIFGVFYDTIIGKKVTIPEGAELYPINIIDFIKTNTEIIILFIISITVEIFRYVAQKKGELALEDDKIEKLPLRGTLFFLSILFLAGSLLSGRNMDFFFFFAAAYIAISINDVLRFVLIKESIVRKALPTGLLVVFIYLFSVAGLSIQSGLASVGPYDNLESTAQWLKENTPSKSVVFNASWGWFPQLFYYNSDNFYVTGIEPRFLYDFNQQLYWEQWSITTKGYICYQPACDDLQSAQEDAYKNDDQKKEWLAKQGELIAQAIKKDFQSQFIVTSVDYRNFNNVLDSSDKFEKVFTDDTFKAYFIYKVK